MVLFKIGPQNHKSTPLQRIKDRKHATGHPGNKDANRAPAALRHRKRAQTGTGAADRRSEERRAAFSSVHTVYNVDLFESVNIQYKYIYISCVCASSPLMRAAINRM